MSREPSQQTLGPASEHDDAVPDTGKSVEPFQPLPERLVIIVYIWMIGVVIMSVGLGAALGIGPRTPGLGRYSVILALVVFVLLFASATCYGVRSILRVWTSARTDANVRALRSWQATGLWCGYAALLLIFLGAYGPLIRTVLHDYF